MLYVQRARAKKARRFHCLLGLFYNKKMIHFVFRWDDGSVTGVGYLFSEPSVEYFEPAQEEEAKLSPEQKDEIRRLNTPGLKFFVGKLTHEGHLMDTLVRARRPRASSLLLFFCSRR